MDYENLTPQYRIEEYLEAIVSGWVDATMVAYPEVPSWRIEEFLDAFITYIWEDEGHPRHPCPNPVWRLEECLRAIYDVMTGAATPWPFPTPTNRIEEYLAAIHAYLADGTELPVPEPVWRIEQWLAYVLDAVKQGGGVETTVSGTMVHITNALAKAALSVLASIEPIQDLHGYSSPWPAGGGKNLADVRADNATSFQRILVSGDEGYLTFETTGSYGRVGYTVPVVTGQTYTISFKASKTVSSNTNSTVYVNDIAGNWNYSYGIFFISKDVSDEREYTKTITATSDTLFLGFYISAGDSYPDTVIVKDLQVELGSSKTSYSPYSNICPISGRTGLSVYVSPTQDQQDATTYAVDWTSEAGTVYGGTLDVVTGVLTVTHGFITLVGGNEATYSNNGHTNNATRCMVTISGKANGVNNMTSNQFVYNNSGDFYGIMLGRAANNKVEFYLPPSVSTNVADQKAWFSDNPTEVCFELATPLTYQLSAQEVQMLLGENNVWSSSGDTVSVTYYAEGNANPLQSLNILLGGNYSNPKTADDVSDKEALEIILGGNK